MRRRYIVTIITAFIVAYYFSQDEERVDKQVAHDAIKAEPDYFIEGLELSNYGKEGSLKQQIDADKATHYSDTNSILFEKPRVILREGSLPLWGVTSSEGQLIKGEILILTGNVQIVPLQKTAGEFSFSTESLNINLTQQIADTDSKVIIESDSTKLTANGMNMNMGNQTTQFKSKVRGLHDPKIQ
jgi:lipopolysaccharide export system protein LptC